MSIMRRRNVLPPKSTSAAKFNLPTRLWNSHFVIDRVINASLSNSHSLHSLLFGEAKLPKHSGFVLLLKPLENYLNIFLQI